MEPQESAVQYSRWNNSQDEVSMNVSTPESSGCERVYSKLWLILPYDTLNFLSCLAVQLPCCLACFADLLVIFCSS
uniref:Uncharacterized protein n=1 Tax=Monodelphis domestica TaxID=13616 RepID=A0A5F8GQZ4_MONDO